VRKWLLGSIILLVAVFMVSWQLTGKEPEKDEMVLPVQTGSGVTLGNANDLHLLTRIVAAEAGGEPYEGQVAVAAVLLNRVKSPSFPNSVAGVVYQPLAFESVMNGLIWRVNDLATAERAARAALNGWDPTYGSLFFWNPSKQVSRWIWTRKIVRLIGDHVFGI
jgi:N-acetylmuramoyl-L-alanine amidase